MVDTVTSDGRAQATAHRADPEMAAALARVSADVMPLDDTTAILAAVPEG